LEAAVFLWRGWGGGSENYDVNLARKIMSNTEIANKGL
jgi:hypothetical protein